MPVNNHGRLNVILLFLLQICALSLKNSSFEKQVKQRGKIIVEWKQYNNGFTGSRPTIREQKSVGNAEGD
jgi:hypothetical protein